MKKHLCEVGQVALAPLRDISTKAMNTRYFETPVVATVVFMCPGEK